MSKTCKEYFGERLKSLRSEKGLSQDALSKDLGISKGALCYYENCDRTPDITILDKVAKYFNVSLDYLMGYTENKTIDVNIKAICEYTGLSEKAIKKFNFELLNNGNYYFDEKFLDDDEKKYIELQKEVTNAIIEIGHFFHIVRSMVDLEIYSKDILSSKSKLVHTRTDDILKIAEKLEMNHINFYVLVGDKLNQREDHEKEEFNSIDLDELENICDLCRYSLIKCSEEISEMFDYRYDYLDFNRSELLDFFGITENDIKKYNKEGDPNAHHNPPQE